MLRSKLGSSFCRLLNSVIGITTWENKMGEDYMTRFETVVFPCSAIVQSDSESVSVSGGPNFIMLNRELGRSFVGFLLVSHASLTGENKIGEDYVIRF